MSIIRKIGKYLASSLFTIFLILSVFVFSFAQSSEYATLKSASAKAIESRLQHVSYENVSAICQVQESVEIGIEDIGNISVPCNEVKNREDFLRLFADAIFDKIYFKRYTCKFLECIKQEPLVVLSAHANSFFKSLQLPVAIAAAIFGVIYLLLAENTTERLKGLGSAMTFCGLQFFLFSYTITFLQVAETREILDPLFSKMTIYFSATLAIGISLLIASYISKKSLINKK
jgi:hypothetical protein